MAITLTESAVRKLVDTRKSTGAAPDSPVRIKIKGGGCAGYTYDVGFESEQRADLDNEFVFDTTEGDAPLRVLVDPKSYLLINGTEVDFINTLMEQRFAFRNPNAQGECGCGTSFAI